MEGFVSFFGCDDELEKLDCLLNNDIPTLPPEPLDGNIEYKLKLVNPCIERLEHLMSQMKWRIEEGNGIALYELGVEDNGNVTGLLPNELISSLDTICRIVDGLKARMNIIGIRRLFNLECLKNPILFVVELLVYMNDRIENVPDTRVAVIGSVDAGKSTLIGTLSSGLRDNGNGRSRLTLFRHLHEVLSGRTSSISEQIIGIERKTGHMLTFAKCRNSMELIFRCKKLITLIDLAGHRKYIQTTLFGLTSRYPHYAMVLINKSRGLVASIIDQINYLQFFQILPIIIVTKSDLDNINKDCSLENILRELRSPRLFNDLSPFCYVNAKDMEHCVYQFVNNKATPVFQVSCVSGEGLENLSNFFCILPSAERTSKCNLENDNVEFQIDQIFSFKSSTLIFRGILIEGILRVNSELFLGPLINGSFYPVQVISVRRLNVPIDDVYPGQSVSIAVTLTQVQSIRRKGLVLISNPKDKLNICRILKAQICILPSVKNLQALRQGCQITVHMNNICQSAIINHYKHKKIRNCGNVTITFQNNSEYVKVGRRLILRNESIRAVGIVTSTF